MVKSQMKIQQMAFMLMAVFLFFILVGLFYLVSSSQSLKKDINIENENNAIELTRMLASSPELTCGDYCIDADRALVLANRSAYKNFWKVQSIEIRTVYPENTKEIPCTLANENCNYIKIYDKGEATKISSYVSLCRRVKEGDYIYPKCQLAKLIVGYEVNS